MTILYLMITISGLICNNQRINDFINNFNIKLKDILNEACKCIKKDLLALCCLKTREKTLY